MSWYIVFLFRFRSDLILYMAHVEKGNLRKPKKNLSQTTGLLANLFDIRTMQGEVEDQSFGFDLLKTEITIVRSV